MAGLTPSSNREISDDIVKVLLRNAANFIKI
jgi:hypothetical protein